jgi:methyl-accepting chemotaxis protein
MKVSPMNSLKNMKIGTRLGLGFGLILLLSLLSTLTAIARMQAIALATHEMMQKPLAKERWISEWHGSVLAGARRTTAVAVSSDPSLVTFFAADATVSTKRNDELVKLIVPALETDAEKQLYQQVVEQRKLFVGARDQISKLKAAGQVDEASAVFKQAFAPAAARYPALLADLVALQRKQIDANAASIDATSAATLPLLVALAALVLVIGAVLAWLLTTGITGPLRSAVGAARRVADGDLTGRIAVDSRDEVGDLLGALRDMNDNLLHLVRQVRDGTDAIATASGEIAAGNLDLSARTEQQAGSLEETASSMEELTSTVKQNAANAQQANTLAQTASDVALRGGAVVAQVVQTMGAINDSSRKIADIIAVIDGIAFQTNILALNAAVEAARAGEQGRGFAVVASEVRSLAQRSAAAAKEIKALIDESVGSVGAGTKLVGEAGSTMDDIVTSIARVTDIMAEISTASHEQTGGIEQVNRAIIEMDNVTQQNAALVEQAASAADSLQQQAGTLAEVVAAFRLDEHARAPASRAPVRATPAAKSGAAARAQPKAIRATPAAAPPARAGARKVPASVADKDEWETF